LVFRDAELEVAGFEGGVAQIFEGGGDFENVVAFPLLVLRFLVFGVVFVGVTGCVGDLFRSLVVVLTLELAAV
jgi:hypothetical protein